jgi:DNA polymerase III gamma/tau subunit
MTIETDLPLAVSSYGNTERNSDFNTQIESLEQKMKKLAKQVRQMQTEQKDGETASAQQQNLQRQMDNIKKRISLLADRSNQSASASEEQQQPIEHNDQFIKSEDQSQKSPGIYEVKKDGEGGTAVSFNRPEGEAGNALRDETGTAQPDSTTQRASTIQPILPGNVTGTLWTWPQYRRGKVHFNRIGLFSAR